MSGERVERVLTRLADEAGITDAAETGIDVDDLRALVEYVLELGGTEDEIAEAARRRGLGPLALDLAIRPAGAVVRLADFLDAMGDDAALARRVWRAFGLPDHDDHPVPTDAEEAVRVVMILAASVGEEAALGFARVVAAATTQIADALANLSRVGVELPSLDTGMPYSAVVREYSAVARDLLPTLWNATGAIFRRHLVEVSYQQWAPDETGGAVTKQCTIGFVDLVGSTEAQRSLPVAELADLINHFEQLVWDLVAGAGGRLVKLIGDEAMFMVEDPVKACRLADQLVRTSPNPVRVGLAHGGVVSFHGDVYGPTVNLAARLVASAAPSSAMVTESVARAAGTTFAFDTVDGLSLRGFPDVTIGYTIRT